MPAARVDEETQDLKQTCRTDSPSAPCPPSRPCGVDAQQCLGRRGAERHHRRIRPAHNRWFRMPGSVTGCCHHANGVGRYSQAKWVSNTHFDHAGAIVHHQCADLPFVSHGCSVQGTRSAARAASGDRSLASMAKCNDSTASITLQLLPRTCRSHRQLIQLLGTLMSMPANCSSTDASPSNALPTCSTRKLCRGQDLVDKKSQAVHGSLEQVWSV